MNRNNIPLILMLVAGAVTCIITFVKNYSVLSKLDSLLIVQLILYFLGSGLKWTLDQLYKQNDEKSKEEGEVIEKETEGGTAKKETKNQLK